MKYTLSELIDDISEGLSFAAILFLIGFYVPGNREPLIFAMLIFALKSVIPTILKKFFGSLR
jgi:hypothetical protein